MISDRVLAHIVRYLLRSPSVRYVVNQCSALLGWPTGSHGKFYWTSHEIPGKNRVPCPRYGMGQQVTWSPWQGPLMHPMRSSHGKHKIPTGRMTYPVRFLMGFLLPMGHHGESNVNTTQVPLFPRDSHEKSHANIYESAHGKSHGKCQGISLDSRGRHKSVHVMRRVPCTPREVPREAQRISRDIFHGTFSENEGMHRGRCKRRDEPPETASTAGSTGYRTGTKDALGKPIGSHTNSIPQDKGSM